MQNAQLIKCHTAQNITANFIATHLLFLTPYILNRPVFISHREKTLYSA